MGQKTEKNPFGRGTDKGMVKKFAKYGPTVVAIIINSLLEQKNRSAAAKDANISFTTFNDWMKNMPGFREKVEAAENEVKVIQKGVAIDTLMRAMSGNTWQAGAWWLERNYPSEFSLTMRTSIDVSLPVKVNYLLPDDTALSIDIIKPDDLKKIEGIKQLEELEESEDSEENNGMMDV